MLPKTLAIIDDDKEYAEHLAEYFRGQGVGVSVFLDSDDLLLDAKGFDFGFYLLDLSLPGVDGVDLIRLLRRRVTAGIVVASGRIGAEVFDSVLGAGADMHLTKPLRAEQIALAVRAVHRRCAASAEPEPWRLDRRNRRLLTPTGVVIDLGKIDVAVMECFSAAGGTAVTHAQLCERLGRGQDAEADNWLHATIYRLRKRIERATAEVVPLQVQPRVGYLFRARLTTSD